MKGDFTRLTFDPKKHYRGVLMQQGRVQLDADWNEQVQIAEHRIANFFSDFVGQSGVPDGHALQIEKVKDRQLKITPGNCYVDGLLVENEEVIILEDNELPKVSGQYLCYLDIWSRHVTSAEDPDLRDLALGGSDTTTRIKTEWRVLFQPLDGKLTIEQIFENYQGRWPYLETQPWTMPTGTGSLKVKIDKTKILDNRLYRVEIHCDEKGIETFKWSQDNGSVVAKVKDGWDAKTASVIELADMGPGVLETFHDAKWVELTDETHEKACLPGYVVPVQFNDSDRLTIGTWSKGNATLQGKIFVRRWDGDGPIGIPTDGTELTLGAATSSGITLKFPRDDKTNYRSGDYWLIPVRVGQGTQDWSETKKPQPEHHYAALARVIIDLQGKLSSCDKLTARFSPITEVQVRQPPPRTTYVSIVPVFAVTSGNSSDFSQIWSGETPTLFLKPDNSGETASKSLTALAVISLPDGANIKQFLIYGTQEQDIDGNKVEISMVLYPVSGGAPVETTIGSLPKTEPSKILLFQKDDMQFNVDNSQGIYVLKIVCKVEPNQKVNVLFRAFQFLLEQP